MSPVQSSDLMHQIHTSTDYPIKSPSLIPSIGPNIWPEQPPSSKPSNLQSFPHSDLLTYVLCGYQSKYIKVGPIIVPLIEDLCFSFSQYFWKLFHKLQPNTNTNTNTSNYFVLFQSLLLTFLLLISPIGGEQEPVPFSSNCCFSHW